MLSKKAIRTIRGRELVKEMMLQHGCSIKRACRVISFDRKAYYYKPKIKTENEHIKMELKKLSEIYPRYGFRKIFNMLRQQNVSSTTQCGPCDRP